MGPLVVAKNGYGLATRVVWCFAVLGLIPITSEATDSDPVKVTLIDPRGRTTDLEASSSYRWKGSNPPELWVDFSLPRGYALKKVSVKGAEVADQSERSFSFRVLRSDPVVSLSVVSSDKPDMPLNVLVDYRLNEFKAWSDADCRKFFVSLRPKAADGPGIHAGAKCALEKDAVLIKIAPSEDLRAPDEVIRVVESQYNWIDPQSIKTVKLRGGSKDREIEVMLGTPRPKFWLRAAVAPSFLYYRETPATVTLSDFGVGAGVWGRFALGRFSVDLGGFSSFVQFIQISTETVKPIWIDALAHVHYHTPWKVAGLGVSLIAGASLAHMIVSGSLYGVSATFGPEIGAEFHQDIRVLTPPKWRAQARIGFYGFSPISITATLNGTYRINSLEAKLPLHLRAECKFFSAGSSTVSNSALGIMSSLGVQADLLR